MAKQRNKPALDRLLAVTKAMADGNRVRVLFALRGRELCVCQITELLGLAPSTVSKHMAVLRQSGLVGSRKDGRWIFYRRRAAGTDPLLAATFDWLERTGAATSEVARDARTLKNILRVPPEELCARTT